MTEELLLPVAEGGLRRHVVGEPREFIGLEGPSLSRVAYSAAHVVADPLADVDPFSEVALDWEATLAYRHYLWSLGLSVAEAMDTAQRGMGLEWETTRELIKRSTAEAHAVGAEIACGAGTDQLRPGVKAGLVDVIDAYKEQCEFIESRGARVILMASRALASIAQTPEDYVKVYNEILSSMRNPVILHWLGEAFDPALRGYWGDVDSGLAMKTCLSIINGNSSKVDGIKISLLDKEREIEMRRLLPEGVKMYTGDDFNYLELIRGDEEGFSHALLGIFDPIAPAASAALRALDAGDTRRYEEILAPTVALSRHIFKTPTQFYKTGVVFLAYLNGHQTHFRMVGGMEGARSVVYLAELFRLADEAGLLRDADLAADRMRAVLAVSGVN